MKHSEGANWRWSSDTMRNEVMRLEQLLAAAKVAVEAYDDHITGRTVATKEAV